MRTEDRHELMRIVREALDTYPRKHVERVILEAHEGRPREFVDPHVNMHLFRQYRNTVSGAPARLVDDALKEVAE